MSAWVIPPPSKEEELAQLFVDYSIALRRAELLRSQIVAAVLALGESRKVADVTATFYKESHEPADYKAAFARFAAETGLVQEQIDEHTQPFVTKTETIRWKELCEYLHIEAPPGPIKPPRVVVKP